MADKLDELHDTTRMLRDIIWKLPEIKKIFSELPEGVRYLYDYKEVLAALDTFSSKVISTETTLQEYADYLLTKEVMEERGHGNIE